MDLQQIFDFSRVNGLNFNDVVQYQLQLGIASEKHLGAIGGNSAVNTNSITTDATAYSIGDTIGALNTILLASRVDGGTTVMQNIAIRDNLNQKSALTLLIFQSDPTGATITNNTAFAFGATSFNKLIAKINVASTDYETVDSKAIATINNLGLVLKTPAGASHLHMVVVSKGTPTFAVGTTSLQVITTFLQD